MDQSRSTDREVATPVELSRLAARLFPRGPLLLKNLQHYRPFICPFGEVLAQVPQGVRVLDIGCGGGLFLGLCAATGRISGGVGFDSSSPAIALAGLMDRSALTVPLEFLCLGVQEPWPLGEFGVVSLIDVLHHVPPSAQQSVIERAAASVARGGRFIYKDMCRRPLWRACMNRLHDLVLARQWIHYVPVEDVERWSQGAGLRLVYAASFNRWWYGHELRVFERV